MADLVRMMHCYYSNRIEGHTPRPRDIERALNQERDADAERRDLQLEARAHMRVQLLIDDRAARGTLSEPASSEFARWVHAEFFSSSSADGLFPRLFPAQVAL